MWALNPLSSIPFQIYFGGLTKYVPEVYEL